MRLFRLYWIPEGHNAAHGAYVRDRADDLVRILALESVRNKAVIVGEDLGTVEPEVRETLAGFGILSYRLLYFERSLNGERFQVARKSIRHRRWPPSTTHDLATIAGFWTGERYRSPPRCRHHRSRRLTSRRWTTARATSSAFSMPCSPPVCCPPITTAAPSDIPELTGELHYAIIGFLASTPSVLWLVNQEDMTKEPAQQNLPGTTAEYPNWSRKMRWSIDDLSTLPEASDCAAMVRDWIEITGRAIYDLCRISCPVYRRLHLITIYICKSR